MEIGEQTCAEHCERVAYQIEIQRLKTELEQTRNLWVDKWCLVNNDRSAALAELDEARAEVERLRKSVEDWHDAAVRAERNAAMSQDEALAHINEVERLRAMPQAVWVRLLADAKRYQTIRRMIRDGIPPFDNDWYDESELDAAIDAAINNQEKQNVIEQKTTHVFRVVALERRECLDVYGGEH